ncbi:hypothetical protein B0H94_10928 [Salsuginibacillus halophilus]|uniref:SPOR domain-containing protein n=1 Tax=Salsuginibacillus halophilus TaxID=517424 RepID=A0A2P8HCL2_9BACI|nr:hypothetical protein [Salsuginibacillus halophilus]PSL43973.1 hypothetical protein B0H94_10928 [Salsuginibacillus halophilus]
MTGNDTNQKDEPKGQSNESPRTTEKNRDGIVDFNAKKQQHEKRRGPYWDDGNREHSPGLPFHRKKKADRPDAADAKKRVWIKLSLLIGAAVVLGVVFGTLLLQLLTSPEPADPASTASLNNETPPAADTAATDWEVTLLQLGAYETTAKAEEDQSQIAARGWPALKYDSDETYFIAAGITDQNETKTMWQAWAEEEEQPIYMKEERIEVESSTKEILQPVINATASAVTGEKLETETINDLQAELNELAEQGDEAAAELWLERLADEPSAVELQEAAFDELFH